MKHRKNVIASTLMIIALAVIGIVLCTNNSAKAAPNVPDVLSILPSDCQFAFGMNVQKVVQSPIYQKQRGQIGNDLSQFVAATGVDPEKDISYLVAAGQANAKGSGVIVAVGSFDKDKITSFIQSAATSSITEYNGSQILTSAAAYKKGLVFLGDNKIALGDLETLKAILDGRTGNAKISSLILSIDTDAMFWFAGNAGQILARAPFAIPAGIKIPLIQNIVGTFNADQSAAGTITATLDESSAKQLLDAANALISLGQTAGNQDPTLQTLLGGLKISQNSNQINLSLSFPADLLDRLSRIQKLTLPRIGIR
jgi:hypothetical protein